MATNNGLYRVRESRIEGGIVWGASSVTEDFWLPRVQVSLCRHFLDCLLFSHSRR